MVRNQENKEFQNALLDILFIYKQLTELLFRLLPLQNKPGIFWLFPEFFLEYDRKDF